MNPLLEVTDLRTQIRRRHDVVHAVDGVSFTLQPGETLGLVGESGCGKTMTGRSLMRLLPPGGHIAGGSIRLADRELTTLGEEKMRRLRGGKMAMVFQEPLTAMNPTLTIGRQIAEVARIHWGSSPTEALDRAVEVLDLVGMPHPGKRLGAYPHELSGGLRQRCVIAMALACEPDLLIADEPTTALDVTIQAQILELLVSLKERLDMALLLITHDLGVIAGQADRVLVMYAGRIVEEATASSLFADTKHPYTEALLQAVPQLDAGAGQQLRNIPGLPPDLARPPAHCRFEPRCARATSLCRAEDPVLTAASADPEHRFACFHPVDERPTARPTAAVPEEPADDSEAATLLDVVQVSKDIPVTAGAVLQRRVGTISAVSDVSFTVARGETLGIVGESGCGKTTLGRMIVALERPTTGQVLLDGVDLAALRGRRLRERRRAVQLVFQDPFSSLDPRVRVGGTLREPLQIQGVQSRRQQDETIGRLLDEVGLDRHAVHRYPHEFSGGQRQRIGLARALALQPELIVADEPVSALDVSIQAQILNLMKRLQGDHGLTYILISHDLAVVRSLADRIGVMYLGKLVELGAGTDVYERPAHPYTAGLLAAVPLPDPVREHGRERTRVTGELPSPLDPPSGCRFRTRCPLAQEICAELEPPVHGFADGHVAACHFPLQTPAPQPADQA